MRSVKPAHSSCFGLRSGLYCWRTDAYFSGAVISFCRFGVLALWIDYFFSYGLGDPCCKTGGSKVWKSMLRIAVWGSIAMGLSAVVGYLFGVNV